MNPYYLILLSFFILFSCRSSHSSSLKNSLDSISQPSSASTNSFEVMDLNTKLGMNLKYGPDGNLGTASINSRQYFYFAAHASTKRVTSNYDKLTQDQSMKDINISGLPNKFQYAAAGPILELPEIQKLVMFYHAEELPDGRGHGKFYTSIGVAVSELDNGVDFVDLGIILSLNMTEADRQNIFRADLGGATFVEKGQELLMYFKDTLRNGNQIRLSVAKASKGDFISAIAAGQTPVFHKFFNNNFSEPGLGGRSSSIVSQGPYLRWPSVSYSEELNKFIMVYSVNDTSWSQQNQNVKLEWMHSNDGVNWSQPQVLLDESAELQYPTIVDTKNHKTSSFEKVARVYYIYSKRGSFARWEDAIVKAMDVDFSTML